MIDLVVSQGYIKPQSNKLCISTISTEDHITLLLKCFQNKIGQLKSWVTNMFSDFFGLNKNILKFHKWIAMMSFLLSSRIFLRYYLSCCVTLNFNLMSEVWCSLVVGLNPTVAWPAIRFFYRFFHSSRKILSVPKCLISSVLLGKHK